MKKILLPIIFTLTLTACPSSCREVATLISKHIAQTYECKNEAYLIDTFSKVCKDNKDTIKAPKDQPASVIGWLVCKACISIAVNQINKFSTKAECKYDFVSKGAESLAVSVCTSVMPFEPVK